MSKLASTLHRVSLVAGLCLPLILWLMALWEAYLIVLAGIILVSAWMTTPYWFLHPGQLAANSITLLRLVVIILLGGQGQQLAEEWLTMGFLLAAALDGVDGWIARKWKGVSLMGERLDEETDALFILVIGATLFQMDIMPFWILVPGWLRYMVALVRLHVPVERRNTLVLPEGRWIAGVSFVLLPLLFILPEPYSLIIGGLVALALTYSFTRETLHYVQH